MRRWIEKGLRRAWSGEGRGAAPVSALLAAPALAFGAGVRVRNALFEVGALPRRSAPIAVVSVGNLAVGGSGKTPLARWFVERLRERGRSPALAARGYGADELELHRRWNPDVPVIAAARRIDGARQAAAAGADVCVLDDGFQHRWIARDLDVLLLSVTDPFPPRLLPRGPYREPLGAARRADLILVTSRTRDGATVGREFAGALGRSGRFPPAVPFPFAAGEWENLDGSPGDPPDRPVLVASSVAHPAGVEALAVEAGAEVADRMDFPDHHPYDATDAGRMRDRAGVRSIVTTEKDAVKLQPHAELLGPVHVLTLRPKPEPVVRQAVERALDEALERAGRRIGRSGASAR